jgi:hypothetical protein
MLVWETALVFVICTAVACGPGPLGRDCRGSPRVSHRPGSLPLPEASIRAQKRELHDREDFYVLGHTKPFAIMKIGRFTDR